MLLLLDKRDAANPVLNTRAKMLPQSSPQPMDQQGSPCYRNILLVTLSYHSKVNFVGQLDVETLAEESCSFVFNKGFPASHFQSINLHGIFGLKNLSCFVSCFLDLCTLRPYYALAS